MCYWWFNKKNKKDWDQGFEDSLLRRIQRPSLVKKTYTLHEVCQHNTIYSCWIIVSSEIYDVTNFIKSHPGGPDALLKRSGTGIDCASDMEFHSPTAMKIICKMNIGKLNAL